MFLRIFLALFFLLLLIASVVIWRLLTIGVAYKAKMLCSEIFLAHRDPSAIVKELELDDLSVLGLISTTVDDQLQQVRASVLGAIPRTASYQDGVGCALLPDSSSLSLNHGRGTAERSSNESVEELPVDLAGGALDSIVRKAFDEANSKKPRRTRAIVIVHRGVIVGENYASGISHETPLIGWSMGKSVVNALIGVLVREQRLSLDAPVPVNEWSSSSDPRRTILLEHLLQMSSGLEFDESYANPFSDVLSMLFQSGDVARYAIAQRLEYLPGEHWRYSSGTTNILSAVIRNVLGDALAYRDFPRRALFEPLGMKTATMELDASGTFVGSSFVYASARDWAKFGQLFLQDGRWGERSLLPPGWVEFSRAPASASPGGIYGAHFWLAISEFYRPTDARLPEDAFHAVGHDGQFVTIVPSRNAVIVRLGRTRVSGAWDHPAFVNEVLAALPAE